MITYGSEVVVTHTLEMLNMKVVLNPAAQQQYKVSEKAAGNWCRGYISWVIQNDDKGFANDDM